MSIRRYHPADFNRLAEIYDVSHPDELYAEQGDFTFIPWAENEYMMTIFAGAEIYVYREDKTILGFCAFTDDHINWFFVHPEHRGKGIGDQMLTYLLANKLKKGTTLFVWKSNAPAKSLYKKHGFLAYQEFYKHLQGRLLLVNKMVYA